MKNTIRRIATGLTLLLLFVNSSCKDSPPAPPTSPTISLTVEDASCTEAWLKVTLTDASGPRTVAIEQDGQRILTASLTSTDSTFLVDSLLPRRRYSFAGALLRENNFSERTGAVQVTTMDTTSHSISWQLDSLGDGGASVLYDVVALDDTSAIAVGELYKRDSLGNYQYPPFNAAFWNGREWTLRKIQFYVFCGQPVTSSAPAKCISVTQPPRVMMGSDASQVTVWNGSYQESITCMTNTTDRLWSDGGSNIFSAGRYGKISMWNGATWNSVESHTLADIQDIFGGDSRILGGTCVLFPASFRSTQSEERLIVLRGNSLIDTISYPRPLALLHSVWFARASKIFACGDGLFTFDGHRWSETRLSPHRFLNRIRGSAPNDVFVVGEQGFVAHFNGASWRVYPEVALQFGSFLSLAVHDESVIAVGWIAGSFKAAALRGRR